MIKQIECLSADYWIENTKKIYEEDLHISIPVMDAYRAGFLKALELAVDRVQYSRFSIILSNDDYTKGYIDACTAIKPRIEKLHEGY